MQLLWLLHAGLAVSCRRQVLPRQPPRRPAHLPTAAVPQRLPLEGRHKQGRGHKAPERIQRKANVPLLLPLRGPHLQRCTRHLVLLVAVAVALPPLRLLASVAAPRTVTFTALMTRSTRAPVFDSHSSDADVRRVHGVFEKVPSASIGPSVTTPSRCHHDTMVAGTSALLICDTTCRTARPPTKPRSDSGDREPARCFVAAKYAAITVDSPASCGAFQLRSDVANTSRAHTDGRPPPAAAPRAVHAASNVA